jgi:signal transduction histidine kinase
VLQNDMSRLTEEQQKAMTRILQAGLYGERLIRQILDVEREDIGSHKMHLEKIDLKTLAEEVMDNFQPMAARKNIKLQADHPARKLILLSDRYLVGRICENLLSNAIKYTQPGKNVWISILDEHDHVSIKIRDEGVGIDKEELPYLFSKYSKISSRPTDGEASNGLGLSIVKRIVEEINGRIICESELGEGSVFTVLLKK